MEFRDYYEVMGVSRDATQDEIKRAYRKLARKYHPDVSAADDAEARFKELGEAYAVLKDPEKRAAYNQLGQNWKSGEEFRPPPDWNTGFEFSGSGFSAEEAAGYSDFFTSLFGDRFNQGGSAFQATGFDGGGQDHHAQILIDIEDSYRGATKTIVLRIPEIDSRGHLVNRERSLQVKIPKGVVQGQRIRLTGQGAPAHHGNKAGDLYLEVVFKAHRVYYSEGRDIYLDLPVAPWEAALGATVTTPTPSGPVKLTIPAGTGNGRKLRLKGRGIPGDPPGDLFAVTTLTLPKADDAVARELFEEMRQKLNYNPRSQLGV